ncbi:MAG: class I adenylate-forming enzyme family protein [Methanocorpusculum sp.]|nr:class I adenylate-forming enzyme family protein [Methanocorpusculum sp.]
MAALNYTEEDKRSLYQALLYGYNRAGDNSIILAFYGRHMLFKQFMDEVSATAAAFIKHGVKKGDCITIYAPNIPQSVIALYAANRIGAIGNMVHPLSTKQEVQYAIDLTESKIVLTVELNEELVSNNKDLEVIRCKTAGYFPTNLKGLVMKAGFGFAMRKYGSVENVKAVTAWTDLLEEGKKLIAEGFTLPKEDGKAEDTAVIMYTGGTTGVSKGVMLSNYAVNSISMQMLIDVGVGKTDVEDGFLAILPIFHAFGLAVTIHAPLISGMKVVLVPRFDPKGCFNEIKRENILFVPGVPALFERMYPFFENYDMSKMKLMCSGGDRVSAELAAKYNKILARDHADVKFRAGYGLTEASGTCTLVPNDYDVLPSGCIGVPMTGTQICVVKPGTTEEVPEGEEGELCFLGPAIMKGYLKNEEATNEVLRKHADGKTWLHTGDIVAVRKDGNICFRSRYKRLVKVNGYNVYPSVIEEIVQAHPSVKQVCAVTTPWKDNRKIKLFVVLNEGANAATVESDLIEFAKKSGLSRWSIPVKVEVVEALPMTKFSKVDYMLLEKQELENSKKQ